MTTEQLAFVQGWDDTRAALRRWRAQPLTVLAPWALGAVAVAIALLAVTWVVATLAHPDPTAAGFPGVTLPATTGDLVYVLERNGLVLALHALACLAGFMAGSSLPQVAEGYSGLWRRIHDRAGPLAIAFVVMATTFSLGTQAYVLGHQTADLAAALHHSPLVLLLALLPHALPELTALFLPLAAWTMASRRGAWKDLLAATFVTVAVAVPTLVLTAVIETHVTPHLLRVI
jgi:Stage II sporulation protein M